MHSRLYNWGGDSACLQQLLRGENMYLQFRAETFNLFNHTNVSTVTTSFISASFGKVTAANDPRIMQLGLKLYF
jgi:hypothetical protein